MSERDQELRRVLDGNVGFDDSARWLDYARNHSLKPVRATRVPRCPDCEGARKPRAWGQYVYYSTLIRLLECAECGLVWADAHVDPKIIRHHFELAYKGDEYFRVSRRQIFEHLVNLLDRLCPKGARVLDVGGARGDLMAQLVAMRPDVRVLLNDISESATSWASRNLGFATLTGDANVLAAHQERYDVVVLSDVLYYEPNLRVLWAALSRLVCQGGSIVIRVPNKYFLISLGQRWYHLTHATAQQLMQDRIRFFNPEHIFIFRPQYLRGRLMRLGFAQVQMLPSPSLAGAGGAALRSPLFSLARIINYVSRYALVLTPAMIAVGRRLPCR